MIRFVEMKGIYLDETKSFGFYNTVTDSFLNINGSYAFDDIEEFKDMYTKNCGYPYERLINKIPKKWLNKKEIIMKEIALTNQYKQALAAKEWLDKVPDRIYKANCYIADNKLNVKINMIHDDIQIIAADEVPQIKIDIIFSIISGIYK